MHALHIRITRSFVAFVFVLFKAIRMSDKTDVFTITKGSCDILLMFLSALQSSSISIYFCTYEYLAVLGANPTKQRFCHKPENVPRSTPAWAAGRGCAQDSRPYAARAAAYGARDADADARAGGGGARRGGRDARRGASHSHGARPERASSTTGASSRPPPSQGQGIAPPRSTRTAAGTSLHAAARRAGTNRRARAPTPFPRYGTVWGASGARPSQHPRAQIAPLGVPLHFDTL